MLNFEYFLISIVFHFFQEETASEEDQVEVEKAAGDSKTGKPSKRTVKCVPENLYFSSVHHDWAKKVKIPLFF